MAATERTLWAGRLRTLLRWLRGLLGGVAAAQAATAATLAEDRSELLYHVYDGGGVRATGPALLVRKTFADRVSLAGSYYVDAVSNASIDVVTTASPYDETRSAYDLAGSWLVRDTVVSAGVYASREPDYDVDTLNAEVVHEVFGGMTTVNLGYTRSSDEVRKTGEPDFVDHAKHWQYRAGVTQVLSPRWLATLNAEAISDEGYLGSPYRVARVFGAAVPERMPRTRSSRAVRAGTIVDLGEGAGRTALRADYRYFWDNWDVRAHTAEAGASRTLFTQNAGRWLFDASLRLHSQDKALFYSDDAQTETLYVTRNRQFSTFRSASLGVKATWTPGGVVGRYDMKLTGAYERKEFRYADFTDIRSGEAYSHGANLVQLLLTARF